MMRIVFMGTPDFSVPTLKAILDAGHDVVAVYSQPPRAAGRGMDLRKTPVHAFAESQGLTVLTPESLKSEEEQARFKAFHADLAVVVAYGLILPKPILEAPRLGCFNLHASLLPRWRGAAPIQRAIMAGDAESGNSIMRMDEGLDTGDVCLQSHIPIPLAMSVGELHDALAEDGARLMVEALSRAEAGTLDCVSQSAEGVTYAAKIKPEDGRIDWSKPAAEIHNQIRGLAPRPGAWFELERDGKRERVKVLRAELGKGQGTPGTLLDDTLTVACGEGALRLLQVQRAGKKAMQAEDFLRGMPLAAGSRLN
ncbi:methionyl-tRNA formyltransferase [Methyloligella sp. 2.7D]|uniref:methionyl-tRNA formyltransferase n=1 Tax=unclassified Methyloligella TaxID=2625955 RepID=UPI00157D1136|nr:methionyl-tRNA formyltransferase [Methyloligella sp. GL2]QKP78560.1 methionyl-tRNA formyltransferase [Methyloligella sp. GL2]